MGVKGQVTSVMVSNKVRRLKDGESRMFSELTSGKPLARVLGIPLHEQPSTRSQSTASGEMGVGCVRSTSDGVHHAACPPHAHGEVRPRQPSLSHTPIA